MYIAYVNRAIIANTVTPNSLKSVRYFRRYNAIYKNTKTDKTNTLRRIQVKIS